MIYFVTYDLKEPNQRYEELIKKIKEYGSWAKLGYSCFLIKTPSTAVDIRNNLCSVLDTNDQLFVGQAQTPAAWRNLPVDVVKWINDNL